MRIESLKILYDSVIENSLSVFEIIKQIRDLIGTRIVLIEVNNEPKLIKLYESLGFECIGI